MCHKLCHFIWGIWWFHWSKDFEAMKAGKLAIWPWLSCPYKEHTFVDLPSSMNGTNKSDQMIPTTISDSKILRTNTVRQIRFHLDSCPKKEKQKSSEWPAASVDSLLMSPNGSRAKSQHQGRRKFWKSGGALCVEMEFYADISWESRLNIEINVWAHFYTNLLVFEVTYQPQVKGMPGKS